MSASSLHPAVAEVLQGLAFVPGMQHVLQCLQGPLYASILAQADLGIPLGPQQVCNPVNLFVALSMLYVLHQILDSVIVCWPVHMYAFIMPNEHVIRSCLCLSSHLFE